MENIGYVTLEYANERLNHSFKAAEKWNELTDDVKNRYIASAWLCLEELQWAGRKLTTFQDHAFPRDIGDLFDSERFWNLSKEEQDYLITTNTLLPDKIQKAQCSFIEDFITKSAYQELVTMQDIGIPLQSATGASFGSEIPADKGLPVPRAIWQYLKYWHHLFWTYRGTYFERTV